MEQAVASRTSDSETLVQFLREAADKFGDRPALLMKTSLRYRRWSYLQLWEESGQVARLLGQQGVARGDRVLIWGPNCPQWVLVWFGCMRAGIVAVPLDLRSAPDFVASVVAKTRPALAIVSRATPAFHQELALPEVDLENVEGLYQGLPPSTDVEVAPDDLAEIMFTSGTTGDPKGVMVTHRNLTANLSSASQHVPGRLSDRLISILPLSHMFEQMGGLLLPLRCGANVTYPVSRQPTIFFRTMRERGVTLLLLVPQALDLFMKGIEREVSRQGKERTWRFSLGAARYLPMRLRRLLFRKVHKRFGGCLDLVFTGGAALDPELGAKWNRLGVNIIQGYGATEASPVISCHLSRRPRYDSVGPPIPGVQVRISHQGEVLLRGPNITSGYWEAPEQTASVFDDGWYKTGDLGFIDAEGCLHLQGRQKDMIVLANGQNVYPEDIESVLIKHPDVIDAVVVGLPAGSDMQVHSAFLVQDAGRAPDVVAWANQRLADHQQVRGFTVWPEDDFPRTHTLKVKKGLVLDAIKSSAADGSETIAAPKVARVGQERGLRHLVSEVANVPSERVAPEMALGADLNLDSLNRVELLSLIEQELGVYIDESLVSPSTTVADIEDLMGRESGAGVPPPSFYRWPFSLWARGIREVIHLAPVFPLMALGYRARLTGLENLDGLQGPVLFAVNHNAIQWDSLLLLKILPRAWRRRLTFAAAAEITFGNLWLGVMASLIVNAFPLSRDTAVRASLEHLGGLLDEGWSVAIFPEGDQRVGEEMLPFQSGTGLLGVECRTPIVPVHLVNEGNPRQGRSRFFPWRDSVSVRIGKPLTFPPNTSYIEATAALEAAVKAL